MILYIWYDMIYVMIRYVMILCDTIYDMV